MNRDQLLIERKRLKKKRGSRYNQSMPSNMRFSEVYTRACYERRRGR